VQRLRALISIGGLLLLWQCVVWTHWVNADYFPGPWPTLQALWAGLAGGELLRALAQTLARALALLLGATVLGVAVALLTARYKLLKRALDPVAEFFRPLPPAALVPLSIFALGLAFAALTFLVKAPVGYGAGRLSYWLRTRTRVLAWVYRASGMVLVALGLKLAFERRA